MTLPLDRDGDLAHHVYDALEDESAQPLGGLEQDAPAGFESFSELEVSLSEWSFGYGVAWALARMREPFASSQRVSELAAHAVATAWRSFGGVPWGTLMAEDREAGKTAEPPPAIHAEPDPQPIPEPQAPTPPADSDSQLGDFMGGLARARSRRPRGREDAPGE
jgi:hypothetical protein